jgi:hypothetical protein
MRYDPRKDGRSLNPRAPGLKLTIHLLTFLTPSTTKLTWHVL